MKHLYSLVFVLIALTSSHLTTAQIIPNVTYTNDISMNCSGTASAAPTGGTAPYTYQWSTGATTSSITNLCAGNYSVLITDALLDTVSSIFTVTAPNPCANFALATNTTNCSPGNCDGSVAFTPIGGTAPYVYSISGSPQSPVSPITNLCAGVYTAYCTDANGCMATTQVIVTDPCSSLVLSATITNANTGFNNGGIQATATGGNPPYTYSISGGPFQPTGTFTNLFSGSYTIECFDANGCMSSLNVTVIDDPIIPYLAISNDSTGSCMGSASVSPTGGLAPYTYQWSNGATTNSITNLCAGNYSVLITDALLDTVSSNFTITGPNPCTNIAIYASVTNATDSASCDGIIQITASGGTPSYLYAIDGGATFVAANTFTSLCPGSYTVVVMDLNGCLFSQLVSISDSITVNLAANLTSTNDLSGNCSGSASVSPTGGSGGYTYLWSSGQTTSSISNLCPGTYTVLITDSNQDTVTASCVITNPCSNFSLSMYNTQTTPGNCVGYASASPSGGMSPYSFSWSNGSTTSYQYGLCSGTYTVTCVDANGCSISGSAVVIDSIPPLNPGLVVAGDSSGSCNGVAYVSPTGGTAPYTYLWSNGATTSSISNLCVGAYSVTIWDTNGDSITSNFNVTNPCAGLSFTVSTTQSIPGNCIGIISVTPNFSFSGYSWSNGSNSLTIYNLCAGTYTITCAATNGCSVSESITIADSLPGSPFNAGLSLTDDLSGNCSGSATILPTGGFAPYSYYWSTGETTGSIDSLCAGIYSVVVWDSTNIDTMYLSFVINDTSTIYGNNPYPNGAINDTLYTDLVTNCVIDYTDIDSASLYQAVYDSINQNLYVTWAVYSPTDTVYISDTLGLAGAPGYYALTISVYCPNKSGNDFLTIQGVIYFDGTTVHYSTLGVAEHALDNISVYPNPFTSSISIDNKDGVIQSLKLVDLNGRVLSEMKSVNSGMVKMEQLDSVSSGTYLLILSGANTSKTYKVIK